jgi:hypothetical protein
MRRFIGARHFGSKYDLRNHLVGDYERLALKTVSQDTGQSVIIVLYTPWWSPFNVSKKLFVNKNISYSSFKFASLRDAGVGLRGVFDLALGVVPRISGKFKALYSSYAPILMLPSSTIAASVRLSILPIHSLSNSADGGALITFLCKSFIALLLLTVLFTIFYVLLVRSSIKRDHVSEPTVPVFLVDAVGGKAIAERWAMDNYAATHNFYAYEEYILNNVAVAFYDKKYTLFNINECGKNFVGNSETSSYKPLLLISVPKVQTQYSYNGNFIASIIYEFSEFYVRAVEPYFFQASNSRHNLFVYLTIFMRRFIGARHFDSKYDLRNHLVGDYERLALKTVSQDTGQSVIIVPYTPWW